MQTEQAAPPRPFLIGGAEAIGEESQAVIFPYDGSEIARVWLASAADVERALAGAAAAEPLVAAIPPHRRAEILLRAAALVRERADELAHQMTLETGIVLLDSRAEVERTAEIFEFSAAEARGLSSSGELVPIDAIGRGAGRVGLTRRFPVGVVLGITAFNAPLLLVAHKIGPAFAAGNPCIVRPAPKTPLSALALGAIMLEAGAPPEAVTILPSSNELAERMVRDERVRMVSFTGSAPVGWYLRGVAATPRVTLELGGNGAVIVHSRRRRLVRRRSLLPRRLPARRPGVHLGAAAVCALRRSSPSCVPGSRAGSASCGRATRATKAWRSAASSTRQPPCAPWS